MRFDLVHSGHYFVMDNEVHYTVGMKVADANGLDPAFAIKLLHRAPGAKNIAIRLVNEVEIKIVKLQTLHRAVERSLCFLVTGVREDHQFLCGLDGMDTLLQHAECVLLWSASEITRAWLFYEALMSVPLGRASFMAPMEIIAALSTNVRQYHVMFSRVGLQNSLMMVDTFRQIGITATSHRDIRQIIFLMSENLKFTDWNFRVIQ